MEYNKLTDNTQYEKALELLKELRNKNYKLLLKTYTEPMSELEKKQIEKEMIKNKKTRALVLTKIVEYEKENNLERRKNK